MYHRIALCTALALSCHSQAENYQYQVDLNYNDIDVEQGADITGYDVSGTYYLKSIDDNKGPLFEASFINRSSFISLDYSDDNRDNKISPDNDITRSTVSGLYVSPQKGWFVGAAYNDGKDDAQLSRVDSDGYQITLGSYVADNTTLSFTYDRNDFDGPSTTFTPALAFATFPGGGAIAANSGLISAVQVFDPNLAFALAPSSFRSKIQTDTDSLTIALRHLGIWNSHHYSARINYTNGDRKTRRKTFINGALSNDIKTEVDTDSYGVDFAIYPTKDWRLSLRYQKSGVENVHSETYSLGVNWFVTSKLAIDLSYADVKADSPSFTSAGLFSTFSANADTLIAAASTSVVGVNGGLAFETVSSTGFLTTQNDNHTVSLAVSLRF